jgi:hypothetical protein
MLKATPDPFGRTTRRRRFDGLFNILLVFGGSGMLFPAPIIAA